MGGTDESENLIELTIEEHAEAHRVLFEKYEKVEDYWAWKGLSGQIGKEEILKEISINNGKNMGKYCYENKLDTRQPVPTTRLWKMNVRYC